MEAIFVGTLDGVFKVLRSDRGWQVTSRELLGKEVNVLAIHPERREIIYAGIRGGGLFRTDDAGKSWQRLGEKVLSDKIRALALDPSNPETVYVGTEPPALWRSEDGGTTWKELSGVSRLANERRWTYPVPVIQPHIRSIAVDPRNSQRLCLAAQVGGLLLSSDGGASWTDVRYPIDMDVHSVTFDPADGAVLSAVTRAIERPAFGRRSIVGVDHRYDDSNLFRAGPGSSKRFSNPLSRRCRRAAAVLAQPSHQGERRAHAQLRRWRYLAATGRRISKPVRKHGRVHRVRSRRTGSCIRWHGRGGRPLHQA